MARGKRNHDESPGGDGEPAGSDSRGLRLADHPRATRHIQTGRAWVALAAFLFIGLLAHRAGQPPEGALTRALEAGVVGYVVGWAVMVLVWHQLAQAEIEAARRRIVAALLEMEAAEREGGTA
jgi:AcrR family transcriptional regulator